MGLFDALTGNVSEITDFDKLHQEISPLFIQEEELKAAFQLVRDQIIFTNKRLLLIDKQGMTGKKVSYRSIPYSSINQFSAETAGFMDRDSELVLHIKGSQPICIDVSKKVDIRQICQMIAQFVL